MILPGIQLVTFDVTNTLLKFVLPPWEYYAAVARNYGYTGTGKDIKNKMISSYKTMAKDHPNFGKKTISWQQWWTKVVHLTFQGEHSIVDNINIVSKQLIEDYKTHICWQKAQGSDELIHLLKKHGITVGVISNFDPRLHQILSNLGMTKYFEFVLTSYEVGISKPDKGIFEIAQAKCKITDSSHCLHIGDDLSNDYEGAKAAGWHSLLVTDQPKKKDHELNNIYANLKVLSDSIKRKEIVL